MKIDISYYIRQVLREQRMVHVPDLGTFSMIQTPSSYSSDKSTIYPPHLSIDFNDDSSSDVSLATYIQDTGQYQEDKINQAIKDYSQSAFNKLIDVKEFVVEKVGKLSKKQGHDKVSFTPTLRAATDEFKGLISIPISPINRIQEKKELVYAVDTTDIKAREDESSPLWHVLLAGVLVASIIIFGLKCLQDMKSNDSENESIESKIEEQRGDVLTKDNSNTEELDQKYQDVDKLIDPDNKLETKVDLETEIEESSNENKVDEELSHLAKKDDKIIKEKIKNTKTVKSIAEPVEPIVEEEIVIEKVEEITEVDNFESETSTNNFDIPESGNCIIILGSFKKASNVSKMISKIERQNREVFTSQHNGRTRVGFSFDCTNIDLAEYLNDVRASLSKKAWYLDPSLAVPYR